MTHFTWELLTGCSTSATLPGCDVYRGHFPGNPVCPGVCHIEMLRECVMKLVGVKVFISSVKQCRLTAVSDPLSCSELKLTVSLEKTDEGYAVSALLEDEEKDLYGIPGQHGSGPVKKKIAEA